MEPIRSPKTELDFSKYSILIVDDNPTNLKVLFDYLEQYGFDILVDRDGESAIQRAACTRPDIILLDVVMPEMNGRDLANILLSLYPNLKRLFMSGYTANVIAHHGILNEGVQFIRGRVAEVTDWAVTPEEEGKLIIRSEDTLIGVPRRMAKERPRTHMLVWTPARITFSMRASCLTTFAVRSPMRRWSPSRWPNRRRRDR